MTPKQRMVSCPQCGKGVVWERDNPYRPFCGERCKMIDLGGWASESYRVPVVENKDDPETDEPGTR
jgi:endogenous inhibitor of DNA gyrase (YacG/DUF329 family)